MRRQKINVTYLASTSVGTPDPRQDNPPLGEMLVIDWQVPFHIQAEKPKLQLYVIYWNNEEKEYSWPIERWKGYRTFSVLNDEFVRTGGFLTYRAEIVTEDGKVYKKWKHQLWVNLIKMEDTREQPYNPPLQCPPEPKFDDFQSTPEALAEPNSITEPSPSCEL